MINENPLKNYIHKKFKIIYDNIIAVICICIINVITVFVCLDIMFSLSSISSDVNVFAGLVSIVIVDIIGSCVLWAVPYDYM